MSGRGVLIKRNTQLTGQNYSGGSTVTFNDAGAVVYDTNSFYSSGSPTVVTVPAAVNGLFGIVTATAALSSVTASTPGACEISIGGTGGTVYPYAGNYPSSSGIMTTSTWLNWCSNPIPLVTGNTFSMGIFSSDTSISVDAETNFGLFVLDIFSVAHCLCVKSSDQTTADYSTPTAVAWDTNVYDTFSLHSTSVNNTRITIPAGMNNCYVQLRSNVVAPLTSNSNSSYVAIRKNGTSVTYDGVGKFYCVVPAFAFAGGAANVHSTQAVTGVIQVQTGDYFECLYYNQDTSVTIDATKSSFSLITLGVP